MNRESPPEGRRAAAAAVTNQNNVMRTVAKLSLLLVLFVICSAAALGQTTTGSNSVLGATSAVVTGTLSGYKSHNEHLSFKVRHGQTMTTEQRRHHITLLLI